jgi:hypothetical protein
MESNNVHIFKIFIKSAKPRPESACNPVEISFCFQSSVPVVLSSQIEKYIHCGVGQITSNMFEICDPAPQNESLCTFEKSEKKGKLKTLN